MKIKEGPATVREMLLILDMTEAVEEKKQARVLKVAVELIKGRVDEDVLDWTVEQLTEAMPLVVQAMNLGDSGPQLPDAFKDWK